MPFMATGARDSALPIMHYHTVLSYPQSRGRHSHRKRNRSEGTNKKNTQTHIGNADYVKSNMLKIKFLQ